MLYVLKLITSFSDRTHFSAFFKNKISYIVTFFLLTSWFLFKTPRLHSHTYYDFNQLLFVILNAALMTACTCVYLCVMSIRITKVGFSAVPLQQNMRISNNNVVSKALIYRKNTGLINEYLIIIIKYNMKWQTLRHILVFDLTWVHLRLSKVVIT